MPSRNSGRSALSSLVLAPTILLVVTIAAVLAITLETLSQEDPSPSVITLTAIVAIVAFLGITALLIFQARVTKTEREEARRSAVTELLKMAMDDPDLDEAWGPVPEGEDRKARRQLMYINMIISEWQMSFETKALPETRLRAISREMFSGRPGRAFWQEARQVRMNTSGTKRARRFHQILDEEYNQAPAPPPERSRSRRPWALLAGATAGTLALVPIIHRAFSRPARRRPRR